MEELIRVLENYTEEEITEASKFRTDLGLSSFDTVCMIDEIEEAIGVKIDIKDFVTYKTVGEMVGYIATLK